MATGSGTPRDLKTERYFDEHVPEYSDDRLEFAARTIAELGGGPGSSLVDLGCGAGNTLSFVREQTGITDCFAIDVSANLLEKARASTGCESMVGSLLDTDLPAKVGRRFDFAIIAAVLHHLIGPSRNGSRELARRAVGNALDMLEPGGHLVVVEPIFYPRVVMDALFYVKKTFASITTSRVQLGGYWNNIGAPVVSYYTNEELEEMVRGAGRAEVVARDIEPEALGRLNTVLNKTNTTIVVRKLH
jgi:SAM-dependent methyltransferase